MYGEHGGNTLKAVGLHPQEELVYRTLLRLAEARAEEVAESAGLGTQEAARHLATLRVKGVATVDVADRVTFRPVSPDIALGTALVREQESLESARRAVATLTEEYRASARRHDADRLVEVITGASVLRETLRDLQNSVASEMMWFCRANPVAMSSEDNLEEFDALGRGVRYRVIYERALLEEPGMMENVAAGIRLGEEARTLPSLPIRLGIVDHAIAVCPLVPGAGAGLGEPTAALVGRSQLLEALIALFESYWAQATPVRLHGEIPGPEPGGGPGEEERFLLSLFVAGVPDKSIASQLGVSRRTVQRRLGELMALAGVDTRPGLAFQAARLGWI
ncbi:helix-turn-helix domain-containing protein [Rhizohabitans arisaemae]|uniref:helix-turn-helix domain-containing protein n=1 Tax=Rhizohabitans arisaemae TaxID=2720610 RepID=UPI0024B25774|nr:helix-turn-helix domain-containing protein [Rhizohabitans arisaemae]